MTPIKNDDLHGSAPDKSHAALLLIDVINDLDFAEAAQLLRHAIPMAHRIAEFKRRVLRTRAQWSRLGGRLTFMAGVRPNSPVQATNVSDSNPRS